jgi:hypothetical protein
MGTDMISPDLERNDRDQFLVNHTVHNFAWNDLTVTVKDRRTKKPLNLIEGISGSIQQGMSSLAIDGHGTDIIQR